MESSPLPDLIWSAPLVSSDLQSGEPLVVDEVELTLLGPEAVTYVLDLTTDEASGRCYGPLALLLRILEEEGWQPADVEGFEVDGEPVTAGFVLRSEEQVAPWSAWTRRAERARAVQEAPPPAPEAVRALRMLDETWEVAEALLGWTHDEGGETPKVAYVAFVGSSEGAIRGSSVHGGPHPPDVLAELVRRATRADATYPEGRPAAVHVADADLAADLAERLRACGIPVRARPTPLVADMLKIALDELRPPMPPPVFAGLGKPEIAAFMKAARAFYSVHPWERLRGDRYLAFRFDDGPWGYANVMGQMQESPGLSVFDDWGSLCRFIHNPSMLFGGLRLALGDVPHPSPLEAAGALEGLTLCDADELHPEDTLHLERLGIRTVQGGYPAPTRHTPTGFAAPRLPISAYADLLTAIATVLRQRDTPVITSIKKTVDVGGTAVSLHYPARGDEGEAPSGGVRLVVRGAPSRFVDDLLPEGSTLTVDAPAAAALVDVGRAVQREFEHAWRPGFGTGTTYLWSDHEGRAAPSPRAADLLGLPELWIELSGDRYRLEATRRPGAADGLVVSIR